ncbi:MAG: hypothetical protein BWY15_01432 [Firmicutes bacterium ADurb.Bin193]|nr:MAG: hypothetical protein BWY15_01432 [Firmicutes bacterium ADurb.Bin193]
MYYFIVFGSVTVASRIKKYFSHDADYLGVMHTPGEISNGGCSYCVKVKPSKLSQVLEASRKFGYKIRGIYKQTDDGKFFEVSL